MREACLCGRVGELEDRTPVHDDGYLALRCPKCGHLDHLEWLTEDARRPVLKEAHGRKIGRLTAV
jgi:phage FluMu protein Com